MSFITLTFSCQLILSYVVFDFTHPILAVCTYSKENTFNIFLKIIFIFKVKEVNLICISADICVANGNDSRGFVTPFFRSLESPWPAFLTMPKTPTCQSLVTQSVLAPRPCVA